MKKKSLLMLALCTTVLALTACGGKETTTDATGTPTPTQAVAGNTNDNTDVAVTEAPVLTEPATTETPAVTEPTVAPIETEIETPTSTPTEAPTPTPTEAPTPTPTEAPKELTIAEQYAINYPFMEYKLFDNVTINDTMNDIQTGYVLYIKNNGDEPYLHGYGVLKPGVGIYARSFSSVTDLYKEYGDVYATTDVSIYLREDELQKCEVENCLFTSYGECSLSNEYYYIIFFNANGTPIYYLRGDNAAKLVTKVDNQLHVDVSGFTDIDWATAKIVYEVNEY